MAVKVCINGQMKRIDTTLHKPVIFLNGQKKVLSKAWTFVNGEKKMLWGQPGVRVDLISSDGLVSGTNAITAVGENWLVTTNNSNYVNRIDISNLSSPSLIQSVAWGSRGRTNGFLSTANKLVFYGNASGTLNRLACDFATGGVSVEKSYVNSSGLLVGDIGSSSIGWGNKTKTFVRPGPSGSGTISMTWGSDVYVNNSVAYSIGHQPSSVSDSNYGPYITSMYLQVTSTSWYGYCWGKGSYASQSGIYTMTTSSMSKIGDSITGGEPYYLDGSNMVTLDSSVNYVDKSTLAVAYSSAVITGNGMTAKIIGRNGDYVYVVQYPTTAVTDGVVTLYLLDKTNLTTVYTQVLPTDPFGENSGSSIFWNRCLYNPQVSGSGFLGVSGNVSGQLRIVRFSELLN